MQSPDLFLTNTGRLHIAIEWATACMTSKQYVANSSSLAGIDPDVNLFMFEQSFTGSGALQGQVDMRSGYGLRCAILGLKECLRIDVRQRTTLRIRPRR